MTIAPTGDMPALRLGLRYFAIVFAFAFAMGVARTLAIAPWIGPAAAVLLEVPIVLLVSWFAARRLLRDRHLSALQRAAMGAIAFALTMVSEMVLSALMRGQGVAGWAETIATPLGLVGLAGQAGFAAIPVFAGCGRTARPAKT